MELIKRVYTLLEEFILCRKETSCCYCSPSKAADPLTDEFRNKPNVLINLDLENREKVDEILLDKLN